MHANDGHTGRCPVDHMRSRRIPALLTSSRAARTRRPAVLDQVPGPVEVGDVVGVGLRLAAHGRISATSRRADPTSRPARRARSDVVTTTCAPASTARARAPAPPAAAPVDDADRGGRFPHRALTAPDVRRAARKTAGGHSSVAFKKCTCTGTADLSRSSIRQNTGWSSCRAPDGQSIMATRYGAEP